jgi:hypothetical protein
MAVFRQVGGKTGVFHQVLAPVHVLHRFDCTGGRFVNFGILI